MVTFDSVMRDLEAAGTAQNRKIYRRHGAGDNQFGVSYATLDAMTKQIKREKNPERDHILGLELWATGNLDAQVLALRLADPTRMDDDTLNQWAREVDNYGMADALGAFAARSANATSWAIRGLTPTTSGLKRRGGTSSINSSSAAN